MEWAFHLSFIGGMSGISGGSFERHFCIFLAPKYEDCFRAVTSRSYSKILPIGTFFSAI